MTGEAVILDIHTVLTLVRWWHGEPHTVLAHEPAWCDDRALRALDEKAHAELAARGLSAHGTLTSEFEDLFGAVFRPEREYYGWVTMTGEGPARTRGVLAGAAHEQGFLLVREYSTGAVTLWAVEPDELLDRFLAQIPPARPAGRRPVSGDYDAIRDEPGGTAGARGWDVDALRELLARPRLGAGSLYTARRWAGKARVRSRRPTNYIDTAEGRWVCTLRTVDGRRWMTAEPGSHALIATTLGSGAVATKKGRTTGA